MTPETKSKIEELKSTVEKMSDIQRAKVAAFVAIDRAMKADVAHDTKIDVLKNALDMLGAVYTQHIHIGIAEVLAQLLPEDTKLNDNAALRESLAGFAMAGERLVQISTEADEAGRRHANYLSNLFLLILRDMKEKEKGGEIT